MNDPKRIIVLQVAQGAIFHFCNVMKEYGLEAGVDFTTHCNFELVTPEIFDSERPQLLITGTVTGSLFEDTKLISLWTSINPQLVVIGYSSDGSISSLPIDKKISKMDEDHYEQVWSAIIDFSRGELRRTVVS